MKGKEEDKKRFESDTWETELLRKAITTADEFHLWYRAPLQRLANSHNAVRRGSCGDETGKIAQRFLRNHVPGTHADVGEPGEAEGSGRFDVQQSDED